MQLFFLHKRERTITVGISCIVQANRARRDLWDLWDIVDCVNARTRETDKDAEKRKRKKIQKYPNITRHSAPNCLKISPSQNPPSVRGSAFHITVQMQQSHSSSPQSQPKQGLDTVLMGFLIEPPELLEGRIQLIGVEMEAAIFVNSKTKSETTVGQKR